MCASTQDITQWLEQFIPSIVETSQFFGTVSYVAGFITACVVIWFNNKYQRN